MASRTVMGFVDTAMVGRLGTAELAAVGLAGILTWTLYSFFNGLLTSINTFVAQCYGAGNRQGIAVVVWQGLYIALVSYIYCGAFNQPIHGARICSAETFPRNPTVRGRLHTNSAVRGHHRIYLFRDLRFPARYR